MIENDVATTTSGVADQLLEVAQSAHQRERHGEGGEARGDDGEEPGRRHGNPAPVAIGGHPLTVGGPIVTCQAFFHARAPSLRTWWASPTAPRR